MVGLSIVLESSLRNNSNNNGKYYNKNTQVINKATMNKPSPPPPTPCRRSSPAAGFLDRCCLCGRNLLAGKDIYMYKGDKAFCSMDCRSNQILMDEEETNCNSNSGFKRDNCSLTAIKGPNSSSQSSSSSSSSGRSSRNKANGFVF